MSIRRNVSYNLLGSIIPIALSLVTVPIYISNIGEARYGVLAIAWLLLGYFGIFDLGLGRATAQRIAALCNKTANERAETFWTALILNVGLGVVGGLLIWPVAVYFFGYFFKVEEALRPEIQAAVPWLILAVPMATLSGVLIGALQAREKFLELNLISVSGTVLFQLLPLSAAVILSPRLEVLLPAALFSRMITLIILLSRCYKHIFKGYAVCFVRTQATQLLRFGGWVTVTSFVGPIMVILDRFIIGAITGAKAVSYYTVPFQLAERSLIIPSAISSVLFPRFSSTSTQQGQGLANESLEVLIVIMTPLLVLGVLLMDPFLSWWITPDFAAQSARVGQIILLGFWINGFARIPYAQIQAHGRPDLVARCHLGEVLPYLALLYLGIHYFGLIGAAVVFSLRAYVDFLLLSKFAGTLKNSFRSLITPSILLVMAFCIASQITLGRVVWVCLVAVQLIITVVWAWKRAPDSLKKQALDWLKPILASVVKF